MRKSNVCARCVECACIDSATRNSLSCFSLLTEQRATKQRENGFAQANAQRKDQDRQRFLPSYLSNLTAVLQWFFGSQEQVNTAVV